MKLSEKSIFILSVLHGLNKYWKKMYCYPSQETILKRLTSGCFHHICRRTLNYRLKAMVSHGLIKRVRRHTRTRFHGMKFKSTLYTITILGYQLLMRMKIILPGYFRGVQNAERRKQEKKKKPCAKNPWKHDFSHKNKDLTPLLQDSG